MRSPLDRRVAVVVLAAAAIAMAVPIAITRAPLPHDEDAREEFLALARRRERATWLVAFDFARELRNGQRLTQRITEVNRPPLHVVASDASVTVDFGDRVASCTTTDEGPRCIEQRADSSLDPSNVYRVVIDLGAYRVERLDDRTIAGEHATCFALVAQARPARQLGWRNEHCYARDGVPLRAVVDRASSVDTQVAARVQRDVTAAYINDLLGRLDQEAATPAG